MFVTGKIPINVESNIVGKKGGFIDEKMMFAFFLSLLLVFPTFAHAEETGAVPASVQVTSVTAKR
nr:hypothetical protein [Bacillus pumilus]